MVSRRSSAMPLRSRISMTEGVEKVLGHAAPFQDQPHEGEEGNGEQRVVRQDAEDALGQRAEERRRQQPELDAEEAERKTDRAEGEGDRVTEQQEYDERGEHERCDVCEEEGGHHTGSLPGTCSCSSAGSACFSTGSGISPLRKAILLISSEMPCAKSRRNPRGTSRRTGQRTSPPALPEISPLTQALTNIGHDSHTMKPVMGSMKKIVPRMSIQVCVRRERRPETTSMRMCSLCRKV